MSYSHTSRRLASDAKIVLERAGYIVMEWNNRINTLEVSRPDGSLAAWLDIKSGTVDNAAVVKLLADRGYNEHGHKR